MTRNCEDFPWPWNCGTPRQNWYLQCSTTTLLVARITHLREELRSRLWNVPTIQNRQITFQTCLSTDRGSKITSTLHELLYGFDYRPPSGGRTRFHLGRGRPRPFEGGNFDTLQQDTHFWRNSTITFRKPLQMVWTTGQNYLWQRPSICIKGIHWTPEITRN